MNYSVEFCGGTHVKNTSEIEAFVLISEEGVARGVRRVVGISGDRAIKAQERGRELLARAEALRESANPGGDFNREVSQLQAELAGAEIPVRDRTRIAGVVAELQAIVKERSKKQDAAAGDAVMEAVAALLESAETAGGVTIVVGEVPNAPADRLRGAIDWVRQKCDASAVLLAVAGDGRVTLLAGMSRQAVERGLKAGELIREIAPIVGGKGGGKADLAQGGGKDAGRIPEALDRARGWMKSMLASD